MSADRRQARRDYSRGFSALPRGVEAFTWLRGAAALAGLAGAVLLVIATFATVIHIRVVTVTKLTQTGWDRHGPALLIIGLVAIPMLAGALRGARPAQAALAVLGLIALLIALLGDQPHIHDTGVIGQDYDSAAAGPSFGYYAETLGSVLVLIAGVALLVLSSGGPRRRTAPETAASSDPQPNVPDTPL
jgi:hypothetical protein